jgi:uncharacterized protein YndB with AHSA1/START domain
MKNSGKLKVTAAGDREIVMTRVFDAPRQMVFDGLTKPELLKRWYHGSDNSELVDCQIDLRVGGAYRYQWRTTNGKEFAIGGVYREIVVPERLVTTEQFEGPWNPGEALVTNVLVEQNGQTTMTITTLSPSPEARDAMLKSGMEAGASVSFDRLEKLLLEAQVSPA